MNKEKRTAFIVGATGFVGLQVVKELCENDAYEKVITFTRREIDYMHPKLQQLIKSFEQLTVDMLADVDDVFCCLGTTIKKAGSKEQFKQVDYAYPLQVATFAKECNVAHFIVISAMWANPASRSFYTKVKGELEESLKALNLNQLSIVRPSLLTGARAEFRLGEKVSEGIFKVLTPVLRGPLRKTRPIEGKTVAQAMVRIALSPKQASVQIFEADELVR
ncbi:MAG: NAD(P)H-binding protein, partial [Lysinibacillus sp.]